MKLIREFSQKVDRLIVVEELEGLIEREVLAAGIPCEGKNLTGIQGELSVEKLRSVLLGAEMPKGEDASIPARPPVLCPGCPHRGVFYVLNKLGMRVMGDIGCYTLAALPPLSAMDCLSVHGREHRHGQAVRNVRRARMSRAARPWRCWATAPLSIAGITSLIDAVYNRETITVVILDNRITGMTGHQQNPATGFDIHNQPAPQLNLEKLVESCGVTDVRVVDPFDLKATEQAIREAAASEQVSVVIARRPCALLDKTVRPAFVIDGCRGCGACMKLSCPAIERHGKLVEINPALCSGCGMCAQVCPFKAIKSGREENV